MIIGLVGKARSGKDTFADILYQKMDELDILFIKMSYAADLKARVMEDFELTQDQINGNLKEVPDTRYPKKEGGHWTPREILQFIGTDVYRAIDESFWVKQLIKQIDSFKERSSGDRFNFIVTDCRFPDEVKAIEDRGGIIIRINRKSRDFVTNSTHASETALDDYVFKDLIELDNSSTMGNLVKEADRLIEKLGLDNLKKMNGRIKNGS